MRQPLSRTEILAKLRRRLDDDREVTFVTGAVLDTMSEGGAVGVRLPDGRRATFPAHQLAEAYDTALGRREP
jgi:hypothetical protein